MHYSNFLSFFLLDILYSMYNNQNNKNNHSKLIVPEYLTKQLNKNDLHYFRLISNRINRLNLSNQEHLKKLPKICAKAEEINKRLKQIQSEQELKAVSELIRNHSKFSSEIHLNGSIYKKSNNDVNFEKVKRNEKKDYYMTTYQKMRRRGMIISKYLDNDLKARLSHLKNSDKPYYYYHNKNLVIENEETNKFKDFDYDFYNYDSSSVLANTIYNGNTEESDVKKDVLNSDFNVVAGSYDGVTYPCFGSFLSKDGQYALIKSLEDIIVKEIEFTFPEMRNKVPRTTTAQYIKQNKAHKLKSLNSNKRTSVVHANLPVNSSANFDLTSAIVSNNIMNSNSTTYQKPSKANNLTFLNHKKVSFVSSSPQIYNCPSLSSDFHIETAREKSEISFGPNAITTEDEKYLTMPTSSEDLEKKLLVTKQISSGMTILDNIRKNKKKSMKTIHFFAANEDKEKSKQNIHHHHYEQHMNPVTLKMSTHGGRMQVDAALAPIRKKSSITAAFGEDRQFSPHSLQEKNFFPRINGSAARSDPIVSYSKWKNAWMSQLSSI